MVLHDSRKRSLEKNNTEYGIKTVPYATFYDKNLNRILSVIDLKGEDKYITETIPINNQWDNAYSYKKILGYNCKSVYRVTEKKDSILVYYTDTLKITGAPLSTRYDVQGVVLEVFDQEKNLHIIASSIKECFCKIIFPQKLDILNAKQSKIRLNRFRTNHNLPPIE